MHTVEDSLNEPARARFGWVLMSVVLVLAGIGALYVQLASGPKTLKPSDLIFEVAFWSILLCWTLLVAHHWRRFPVLCAGIFLMMLGAFSDLLDEFLKLPKAIPNIAEGMLISGGAALTAVGLWRWLKDADADRRRMNDLVGRLEESLEEIRKRAGELEQLNRELQEASRVKSDFMSAMSHELRTPLSISIGYTGLLLEGFGGGLSKVQVETLQNVQHQSGLLYKLISDVLTLGRLEAGKVGVDISEVGLEEVLKHVRGYADQLNRVKQLDLVWDAPDRLPLMATDHVKLEEILQNLIGNAYKFTHRGRIEVRVRDLPDKARVEFSVADTGVGIGARELDRVFEAFHQSGDAHTGGLDGVGLGLSIVRRYLDLLEGEIRVESEVGVGSAFEFTLPYRLSTHC